MREIYSAPLCGVSADEEKKRSFNLPVLVEKSRGFSHFLIVQEDLEKAPKWYVPSGELT